MTEPMFGWRRPLDYYTMNVDHWNVAKSGKGGGEASIPPLTQPRGPAPHRAAWLDDLWPAVFARVRIPVSGVRIDDATAARLASMVVGEFLDAHPELPDTLEAALQWLSGRASAVAVDRVASERRRTADPDLYRDPAASGWTSNPDFDLLRQPSVNGMLTSIEWTHAESVLRGHGLPVLARMGIAPTEADTVVRETLAELAQARSVTTLLEQVGVFEQLVQLFATMVERRGISLWRQQRSHKESPNTRDLGPSIDAPVRETRCGGPHLSAGRPQDGGEGKEGGAGNGRYAAMRDALTPFEWHLLRLLFVEGTQTRLDLANDPWVMAEAGLVSTCSEKKRRLYVNQFIERTLARLGRALEKPER